MTDQLHPPGGLRPGAWYACQEPERPPVVGLTAFDFACPACCIAAEAAKRVAGEELAIDERTRSGLELGRGRNLGTRLKRATERTPEEPV